MIVEGLAVPKSEAVANPCKLIFVPVPVPVSVTIPVEA